jgi:hypothetical protein
MMPEDPAVPSEDTPETRIGDARIAFLTDPDLLELLPPPEPAGRFTPEWFRRLDRGLGTADAHGLPGLTVKACPPVIDAFSLGWIIPLAAEVRFLVDPSGLGIQVGWDPDVPFHLVEQHHPSQIGAPEPPFEEQMPLKWINPWRIKVPDGYSVLFTHPLNHFELPFRCFSGVVDCDRFATTVNFPFAVSTAPADVTLPRGTPLVQVIPLRRDALLPDHEVRASSAEESAEQDRANHLKYTQESSYARLWRVPK